MNKTVKSTKILKEGVSEAKGKNPGGPWKLVRVEFEEGPGFSTFAEDADLLTSGSVITIDNLSQDDQERWSFKKYELVSGAKSATKPEASTDSPDMSKEDWEKKQLIERASFETQTAFKGVIELSSAYVSQGMAFSTPLSKVLDDAIDWASHHFQVAADEETLKKFLSLVGGPDPKAQPTKAAEPLEVNEEFGEFKNFGELLTAAGKKGVTRPRVLEILELKEGADYSNLNLSDAWEKINEA